MVQPVGGAAADLDIYCYAATAPAGGYHYYRSTQQVAVWQHTRNHAGIAPNMLTPPINPTLSGSIVVGDAEFVHPSPPTTGQTAQVGYSITPTQTILVPGPGGAPAVKLTIWDPSNPAFARIWQSNNLAQQFEWDGWMYGSYGTDPGNQARLGSSDYFMRVDWHVMDYYWNGTAPTFHVHMLSRDEERVIVDTYQGGTDPALGLLNIAAGGVLSDPHQLLVKMYTNPPKSYTCSFSFTGGLGGGDYRAYGQILGEDRLAQFFCQGHTFSAGDATPIVGGSVNGKISGYFLSSNKVGSSDLTISAPAIAVNQVKTIEMEAGTGDIDILNILAQNVVIPVTAEWTHNGLPLSSHEVLLYISKMEYWNGTVIEFDENDPDAVDQYVKLRTTDNWENPTSKADVAALTGGDGKVGASMIVLVPGVKTATVTAYDFTVVIEEEE